MRDGSRTGFRPNRTRSQRVQSNSVTSLRLQKRSPTLIGIALQANRAESLPFVSIRVASLL